MGLPIKDNAMDAYTKESRASLGRTNLDCEARQNVRQLIAFVNTSTGYTMASAAFAKADPASTLFNRIDNDEYPEYEEFKEPLKLVLVYLSERTYNDQRLLEIANKFPGTYFHDVVHNL